MDELVQKGDNKIIDFGLEVDKYWGQLDIENACLHVHIFMYILYTIKLYYSPIIDKILKIGNCMNNNCYLLSNN